MILVLSLLVVTLIVCQFRRGGVALLDTRSALLHGVPVSCARVRIFFSGAKRVTSVDCQYNGVVFGSRFAPAASNSRGGTFSRVRRLARFVRVMFRRGRAMAFARCFGRAGDFCRFVLYPTSRGRALSIFTMSVATHGSTRGALQRVGGGLRVALNVTHVVP